MSSPPSISLYKFPFYPAKDSVRLRKELICPSTFDQAVTADSFSGLGNLRFISNSNKKPNIRHEPLYYCLNDREPRPTTLKFSGLLDIESWATQISPYFDHGANMSITPKAFKETKATFAVLPLPNTPSVYSQEVIDCSRETVEFLADVVPTSNIELSKFMRLTKGDLTSWVYDDELGQKGLKLETGELFVAPGDKMCKNAATNTTAKMPDPLHCYESLFREDPELAKYLVDPPLIKDVDGSVIPPGEYQSRLSDMHLRPITVEVVPLVWPNRRRGSTKRGYHLLIKSLQILPKPKPKMPLPTRIPALPACQPLRKRNPEQRLISDEIIVAAKPVIKRCKVMSTDDQT